MERELNQSIESDGSYLVDKSFDSSAFGQDLSSSLKQPLTIKVQRMDIHDKSIHKLDQPFNQSKDSINQSADFSFQDINSQTQKVQSSSFQIIGSNITSEKFSKMNQKQFSDLTEDKKNVCISDGIESSFKNINQSESKPQQFKQSINKSSQYAYKSQQFSIESLEISNLDSVEDFHSKNSSYNTVLDSSIMAYSDNLIAGNIYLQDKQYVNMDEVQMVDKIKLNKISQEKPVQKEIEENIIEPKDQLIYLQKIEHQKVVVDEKQRKEKERKRRLFVSNLLLKLRIEITQYNELMYSDIWARTKRLALINPLVQEQGPLFVLNLSEKNQKHPIDRNFFKQIRKWPKKLFYSIILGPHLNQKMVQRILRFDWPNLKRLELHRCVRENILPKQVEYYVTENRNNFYFLQNFKNRANIQFLAVAGNYFTDLMAITFHPKISSPKAIFDRL